MLLLPQMLKHPLLPQLRLQLLPRQLLLLAAVVARVAVAAAAAAAVAAGIAEAAAAAAADVFSTFWGRLTQIHRF